MPMGDYLVFPFDISHEGEVARCMETALVQLRVEHPRVNIRDVRIEISFETRDP
jgi:hypothetical protein